uniref:Uncharacterized protein n=1 Tax=Oryza nivara TaxID=4536 RepID=A0A0E0HRX0_ORYNI
MAMAQSLLGVPFSRLLPSSSSSSPPTPTTIPPPPLPSSSWSPPSRRRRRAVAAASSLHLAPEDIAELVRNKKVLIAATAASAVGQLCKPFTSSGKDGAAGAFDLRAAVRSGGMPSTHSAAVVAVATSLGLERGFADSIFGMSVVFAAIVMYDAQGVRREVGNHARVLNKLLTLREITQNPDSNSLSSSTSELHSSKPETVAELVSVAEKLGSSQGSSANPFPIHSSGTKSSRLNALQSSETEVTEFTQLKEAYTEECDRLSESVGHTELQVAAGALLGFLVTLVFYATL